MADNYVCTLDAKAAELAKEELHEDPKERLGHVETLRQWVLQQPHLKCKTDTPFLLRFLRTAKFSQLAAREKLENYVKGFQNAPEWLADIDTHDPKCQAVYDTGHCLPLGKDFQGRTVLWMKIGALDVNTTLYEKNDLYKAIMGFYHYAMREENTQVRGFTYVFDLTGYQMKHMTYWGMDDMKRSTNLFQSAYPGRFKSFNYYNIGPVFETVVAAMKPFTKKKITDRVKIHDNLEGIYKMMPMELLPDEYLPDDYQGARTGTFQQITEKIKAKMTEAEVRKYVLGETNSKLFHYDKAKKPNDVPAESFRKLTVE